MSEMRITVSVAGEKPPKPKMTAALLKRCREFYDDPENERAYQEWKAAKEKKGA